MKELDKVENFMILDFQEGTDDLARVVEKKELRSRAISSSGSIRVMVITGAMD